MIISRSVPLSMKEDRSQMYGQALPMAFIADVARDGTGFLGHLLLVLGSTVTIFNPLSHETLATIVSISTDDAYSILVALGCESETIWIAISCCCSFSM
jgi:hypothetical protein